MLTNQMDAFFTFRGHIKVTKHSTIRYVRHGFLLVLYSNFVPNITPFFFRYLTSKNVITLKSESEVTQGHRN